MRFDGASVLAVCAWTRRRPRVARPGSWEGLPTGPSPGRPGPAAERKRPTGRGGGAFLGTPELVGPVWARQPITGPLPQCDLTPRSPQEPSSALRSTPRTGHPGGRFPAAAKLKLCWATGRLVGEHEPRRSAGQLRHLAGSCRGSLRRPTTGYVFVCRLARCTLRGTGQAACPGGRDVSDRSQHMTCPRSAQVG